MKFRNLRSLVSVISLALVVPACGDDDSGNAPDTNEEDAGGGGNEDPTEDGEDSTTEDGDDTTEDGDDTTEETPVDTGDAGGETPSVDGGTDVPVQTDGGGAVNTDAGGGETTEPPPEPECPDVDDREIVDVPLEIDEDTVWSCDKAYLLPNEPTVVIDGATLTIEPGVEVWGQSGSALVITRGSKIDANGQANAPIVFTSSALPGQRAPGNWGGVLLLGGAPVNEPDGEADAEGIDPTNGYSAYGGEDETSDCGSMSYVRIEFGGYQLSPDNELNNLGVAGCGSATELHHIQLHKGSDDGIEFWGGSPVVHHVVSSSNSDDSFDWTSGFSSNVQFLVLQQDPGDADVGFEADGNEDLFTAEPLSQPTFYNVTALGGGGDSIGAVLRRGTAGKFYNSIFSGFQIAVDVRDPESIAHTEGEDPALTIENTLFFDNGADGETHFPTTEDPDDGFDEEAYFTDEAKNNVFDADPEFGDAESLTEPNFVPSADGAAAEGAKEAGDGFTAADYLGAFEPGGADWTAGWTAYPEN
jgi:hypothetical protein